MSKANKMTLIKPVNVMIKPTQLNLEYNDLIPEYWFDNDPFKTHLFNALSILFPKGEQFFADSVRHFRDRVTSKQQQEEVAGFIGQELLHSLEHKKLNKIIEMHGYPLETFEAHYFSLFEWLKRNSSPEGRLAHTCALEHITAIASDAFFQFSPALYEQMHYTVRPVWFWHCIEETEHKSVAYDVYALVDGSYWRRVYYMGLATLAFSYLLIYFFSTMMMIDKAYRKPKSIAKGLWFLFGIGKNAGFVRKQLGNYFSYLIPNFHPWKHDNVHRMEVAKTQLAELLKRQEHDSLSKKAI